jgi:hypothetical protein
VLLRHLGNDDDDDDNEEEGNFIVGAMGEGSSSSRSRTPMEEK